MKENISTQYDAISGQYVKGQQEHFGENDWSKMLMYKHISEEDISGKTIADIGCGHAPDMKMLLDLGAERIIGVDPSVEMLKLARETNNKASVEYVQGDFDNIPLPDESVDLVFSKFSLQYSENLDQAYSEIARVLKHDGKFVALIPHPVAYSLAKKTEDGYIEMPIYEGVTVKYKPHSMKEYLSDDFFKTFDLNKYDEFWIAKDVAACILGGVKKG